MKRSLHSLSHYKLFTTKMGQLTPIQVTETLPGDTFQQSTSVLIRCSPLVTPPLHPVHVRVHHWFVPTRLIWTNFVNFITGGPNGMDATVAPTITANPVVGTLPDYLGVPTGANLTFSALPIRAYNLIFNEFYRDQDLVTALPNSLADGADAISNTSLQNCAWEKDFYTLARPWSTKGNAVTLPLGSQATVRTSSSRLVSGAQNPLSSFDSAAGAAPTANRALQTGPTNTDQTFVSTTAAASSGAGLYPANLYADLSTATATDIVSVRHAFALQRYQELRARYGSRFTEYLRAAFGVRSSDARLQRPEYLGGGKASIQFSEVLQTGVTTSGTGTTGVGTLVGHGIGATRSRRYRRFFEEHGYVVTLLTVLPKSMYATGLPKMWSYATKEDYFQKELEHIGQQAILNQELYNAQVGGGGLTGIFGYADRYDQYRRAESSIAGGFRTTFNTWHLARIFTADVALNSSFVTSNPTNRVFQDQTGNDTLYCMANHSIQARRLVSKSGDPGLGVV